MPEPARAADLAAIRALLQNASLPVGGLEAQFPAAYWVLREARADDSVPADAPAIVGAAGLEHYADVGLLRSLVIRADRSGRGLGGLLVKRIQRTAVRHGMRAIYVLTTTAPDYFPRFGFSPASRSEAPAALQASPEFAALCPASAACFVWRASAASFS